MLTSVPVFATFTSFDDVTIYSDIRGLHLAPGKMFVGMGKFVAIFIATSGALVICLSCL